MERLLKYLAILTALLIVSVYFVGFATDSTAVGGAVKSVLLSLTGRNAAGNFADYPASTRQLH